MPKFICDRSSYAISQREYTDEGFLRVPGRVARAGNVQEYYAKELDITDRDPMDIVKVYRPPEEVFNADSLESYKGADITDNHPNKMVDADSFKDVSKGVAVSPGRQEGDFVVVDLIIKDKNAIKAVESGKVQLSAGYSADYEKSEGTTPTGENYDYIQRNIKINHVALVDRARAGGQARIFDNQGALTMPTITLDNGRTVTLDNEANAALVSDSLDRQKATIDTQTALIDEQKDEITSLKAQTSDEAISKRIKAVTVTTDNARKIAGKGFTCDSCDPVEIQRTALAKSNPNRDYSDKSAAYIQAAFDQAIDSYDMGVEEMREALKKKGADMEKVEDMSMEEMKDMMKEYEKDGAPRKDEKTNDSHRQFAKDADPTKDKDTNDGKKLSAYDQLKVDRANAHKRKES